MPEAAMTCRDITFDPVVSSDGKPLTFDFSNAAFGDAMCPTIRMAFILLGKSRDEVREIVRGLVVADPSGDIVMELIENLGIVERKFSAISGFASMAQARLMIVGEAMEDSE